MLYKRPFYVRYLTYVKRALMNKRTRIMRLQCVKITIHIRLKT